MRIDPDRFLATFEALTADGATPEGGLSRPALSRAHLDARRTFRRLAEAAGFEVAVDGAGNHSALLRCERADAPTFVFGSHLDSVPGGGRFDGALGVAAAFEALQVLSDSGLRPKTHLEVIDFTDEEGSWVSLMGSRAFTGQLSARDLASPRGRPKEFAEALLRSGLTPERILGASRADESFAGYLEVHIEQGTRLQRAGLDIGVASGMVGIRMYLVTFRGRADHAGTSDMRSRRDAAQGAASFCLAVRQTVLELFPDCVANVGRMTFSPGAFNIVPETVTVCLEHRSQHSDRAQELEGALRAEAARAAEAFGLGVDVEFLEEVLPAPMDEGISRAVEDAAGSLGLSYRRMPSLAGHDAQSMARICPAGLLFIPSVGGFSHSSLEYSEWKDCLSGADTLLRAIASLSGAT